jgi:hypothetical protein
LLGCIGGGAPVSLAVRELVSAEDQHSARYAERLETMQTRIAEALHTAPIVRFSAYKVDGHDLPIDNLNEIVFSGRCKFIQRKRPWNIRSYESAILTNPTWLAVAVLANEAILITEDTHHVYLEGLEQLQPEIDIAVLELVMGS